MTNYKQLFLYVLAYFVITMALAYPWHMVLFHDVYVDMGAFQRKEPIMLFGIAAILIQGLVIAYLYPFYARVKGFTVLSGVIFNLVIGLMTYTAMGFATAAKFNIDPPGQFLAYHTVFQMMQFTLTGIALGWIYREKA